MEFMKPEPDDELYLTYSHSETLLIDVKDDEDPLLIRFPETKTETEVGFMSLSVIIQQ
jgi:hypothetical protein